MNNQSRNNNEVTIDNLLVIPPADACSEPNTMMVKFHDAVVADITMRSSDWPEDEAGLTELKLMHKWRVR